MDIAKLWGKLFALSYIFSLCLAENCNWKNQYEYNKTCCDACPSGKYPKLHCNKNTPTKCENCTAVKGHNKWCSRGDKALCRNPECTELTDRKLCKRGEELQRIGLYLFDYICEPCPNETYSDEENSICKPITECKKLGLLEIFPGNRTHNAKCGCQDDHHLTPKGVTEGFIITGVICFALFANIVLTIHLHFRRTKAKVNTKYRPQPDDCIYKLSKEENGEK